jgi:hypothetical protein
MCNNLYHSVKIFYILCLKMPVFLPEDFNYIYSLSLIVDE